MKRTHCNVGDIFTYHDEEVFQNYFFIKPGEGQMSVSVMGKVTGRCLSL